MNDQRSDQRSDQRFDDDLRSVLLADAPRDVPDDLRRRVAAVPSTHPVASHVSAGPAWRHPVPLWIGGAAALVILLALAAWWMGPSSRPGVGGPRSSSSSIDSSSSFSIGPSPSTSPAPTTATPPTAAHSPSAAHSPAPAPSTPEPSPSAGACRAADLEGRILGWQGAAGSRIADVQVTNISPVPCTVRGTPGLQLVDRSGRVLIDSATVGPSGQPHVSPTDTSFELTPGGHLRTQVRASNYCGPAPSPPIDIAFTLPSGGGRSVAVPGTGVAGDLAVPPCLGSTGSLIEMNGWRR